MNDIQIIILTMKPFSSYFTTVSYHLCLYTTGLGQNSFQNDNSTPSTPTVHRRLTVEEVPVGVDVSPRGDSHGRAPSGVDHFGTDETDLYPSRIPVVKDYGSQSLEDSRNGLIGSEVTQTK